MLKEMGKTGRRLSAIGQGAGDLFWNSGISDQEKIRVLQAGIDAGMQLLDTAEAYGNGRSEEIVGQAIRGRRDKVFVATKFSTEHHGYNDVLRAAEQSLRRLNIEALDLLQTHWPNPLVPIEETMRAFQHLLKDGKILAVGLSNVSKKAVREAQAALGADRITSVQTEYNLLERMIEKDGLLDHCRQEGLSIIAYSPLDQGQFSEMPSSRKVCLESIAQKHKKTVCQIILRWLVRDPAVFAITRTTQIAHARQNAEAAGFELEPADIEKINKVFQVEVAYVPANRIRVSLHGEWNRPVYVTLEEALENKLGSVPSPADLARDIRDGEFLKPVKLVRSSEKSADHDYDLVGGRIRYWAWIIANGWDSPIPAYVRQGDSREV